MSQDPMGLPEGSRMETYDFGYDVEVLWFPAVAGKFGDRLEEIASRIVDEIIEIGSLTIFIHRFAFEDEEIMIRVSEDEERELVAVDADLVAFQKPVGKFPHDGKDLDVMMPVPASVERSH